MIDNFNLEENIAWMKEQYQKGYKFPLFIRSEKQIFSARTLQTEQPEVVGISLNKEASARFWLYKNEHERDSFAISLGFWTEKKLHPNTLIAKSLPCEWIGLKPVGVLDGREVGVVPNKEKQIDYMAITKEIIGR